MLSGFPQQDRREAGKIEFGRGNLDRVFLQQMLVLFLDRLLSLAAFRLLPVAPGVVNLALEFEAVPRRLALGVPELHHQAVRRVGRDAHFQHLARNFVGALVAAAAFHCHVTRRGKARQPCFGA